MSIPRAFLEHTQSIPIHPDYGTDRMRAQVETEHHAIKGTFKAIQNRIARWPTTQVISQQQVITEALMHFSEPGRKGRKACLIHYLLWVVLPASCLFVYLGPCYRIVQ